MFLPRRPSSSSPHGPSTPGCSARCLCCCLGSRPTRWSLDGQCDKACGKTVSGMLRHVGDMHSPQGRHAAKGTRCQLCRCAESADAWCAKGSVTPLCGHASPPEAGWFIKKAAATHTCAAIKLGTCRDGGMRECSMCWQALTLQAPPCGACPSSWACVGEWRGLAQLLTCSCSWLRLHDQHAGWGCGWGCATTRNLPPRCMPVSAASWCQQC